jgi:hypothetical protein
MRASAVTSCAAMSAFRASAAARRLSCSAEACAARLAHASMHSSLASEAWRCDASNPPSRAVHRASAAWLSSKLQQGRREAHQHRRTHRL